MQDDQQIKNEKIIEEQRISFSVSLVSYLTEKKKEFNKENKTQINIKQLKEVYINGAAMTNEDLNLHGLARVSMFLRKKIEKWLTKPADSVEKISKLTLETEDIQAENKDLDISSSWVPSKKDFDEARGDLQKYNLNFDFKKVEELYLDGYQPFKFDWE